MNLYETLLLIKYSIEHRDDARALALCDQAIADYLAMYAGQPLPDPPADTPDDCQE